jgi:hypothetical protein
MNLLKPLRFRNMTNFRNAVFLIMAGNGEIQRNNFKQSSPYLKSHSFMQILTLSTHLHPKKTKLRGRSPLANYTDRETAACRRN